MADVRVQLTLLLEQAEWKDPRVPVVANTSGAPLRTGREVLEALSQQIDSPLLWTACIATLRVARVLDVPRDRAGPRPHRTPATDRPGTPSDRRGIAGQAGAGERLDRRRVRSARTCRDRATVHFPLMMSGLDPATLASQRCVPADGETPLVPADEIDRLRAGLDPAWTVGHDRLARTFAFPTFGAAFGLATRIALLAEGQGHHPSMEVAWGHLTVDWTTDAVGGITANDVIMAAKVDRLVHRGFAIKDDSDAEGSR